MKNMPNSSRREIAALRREYQSSSQMGLVVGAGITAASNVPMYMQLARDLIQEAGAAGYIDAAKASELLSILEIPHGPQVDPSELLQIVRDRVGDSEWLAATVKKILYRAVSERSHKLVPSAVFRGNETLNALISFCAAPEAGSSNWERKWTVNPKVGAILTTNYDNLLEGSFGSKYGQSGMLKPVARATSDEHGGGGATIPVYHMHGYVSYVHDASTPDGVKASEDLVLAEEDYYRAYYNLLSFSSVAATSFLRRYPSIFIGCSMADRNLRRILYHVRRERRDSVARHFALMFRVQVDRRPLVAALLSGLGVRCIWVDTPTQIAEVLKEVYCAAKGVKAEDWERVYAGGWRRGRRAASA